MDLSKRVLVLFEPGRGGVAVLDCARELAGVEDAELTIVGVAPQASSGARCGNSASDYNRAVADSVAHDLERARELLGELGANASYELLVEGTDAALAEFAAAGGFDLVLLPARRRPLRAAKHPAAASLRAVSGAEVVTVEP